MPEGRKWHFRASRFQNFLGYHAPRGSVTAAYFNRVCRLIQNLLKPLYRSWWFLAIGNCHANAGPRESMRGPKVRNLIAFYPLRSLLKLRSTFHTAKALKPTKAPVALATR